MSHPVVAALSEALAANADPEAAAKMQAYMKTTEACFGVKAPLRRSLLRAALSEHPVADPDLLEVSRALWEGGARELRYLAIDLLERRRRVLGLGHVDAFEDLIRTGAWWDLVDPVAVHLFGAVLLRNREALTPRVRAWGGDDDLWVRRAAVICQIEHREDTDEGTLFELCAALAPERSFWIRKAIGWALRSYGHTRPDAVRGFAEAHRGVLSGLSYREATRRLP